MLVLISINHDNPNSYWGHLTSERKIEVDEEIIQKEDHIIVDTDSTYLVILFPINNSKKLPC